MEEKAFIEKDNFVMDFSARGSICMSSKDKKNLHCIPFFEAFTNCDSMNELYFIERNMFNNNSYNYNEEGPGFIEVTNQIINRLKAGYNLESIERNQILSNNFRGS